MENNDITHFVFVDFENVPGVDLTALEGKSFHVTLLIGKNQRKLDVELVQQIKLNAARVDLVEVGVSGRNALDLILACYLGRAVQSCPDAHFLIVSKDKDYEPVIAHLRATGINVARQGALISPDSRVTPTKKSPVGRLDVLIARMKIKSASRPKKRSRLMAHINAHFGNKLPEAEVAGIVKELTKRGIVSIDDKDKVSYP